MFLEPDIEEVDSETESYIGLTDEIVLESSPLSYFQTQRHSVVPAENR